MSIYLYNQIIPNPDKRTMLLYLIFNDPAFQSRINKFWSLFPKTFEGHISKANFVDLFTNVYTFLQPVFPFNQQRIFADSKVAKLATNGQYIYKALGQIFLEICSQVIENIDLRSVLGFLDLIWSRIINLSAVDINGQTEAVPIDVTLYIYHRDQIQKQCVPEKSLKLLPLNAIYYEQCMNYAQSPQLNTATKSLIYRLKLQQQIIPMGYICQSVVSVLVNTKFQFKQQYEMLPQQRIKVKDIKIKLRYEDKALQPIRDCLINKQTMSFISTMRQWLPLYQFNSYANKIQCYRITEYFARECYFQQLKTHDSHQGCLYCRDKNVKQHLVLCNILSSFHERNQLDIDEIHNVRDKWNKKKKVTLLSDEKKIPAKTIINLEEQIKVFAMKMAEKNQIHFNPQRVQTEVTFMKQKLKQSLEEQKKIDLEKYLSSSQILSSQNKDPFSQDLLQYCKMTPLQLLIVGRPKCGKSLIAKQLAKKYSLIYISVETVINKLFERVKYFEQNPPEVDDEGNPKQSLTAMQKFLLAELENGKSPQEQDIIDLLNRQTKSSAVKTQGFILDLPFQSYNWIEKIVSNELYTPKVKCQYFSHIIQLEQTQEEWKWFVQGLKQDLETQVITSSYERYMIAKPKQEPLEGQQQEQQQQGDDQKPPLVEESLVPLMMKQSKSPDVSVFTIHLHPRNYLQVKIAGKNIAEIIDILSLSLYRIPLAKKIEGNQKQLLTAGLDEMKLVRKWSIWGIVDCVELSNGKLLNGKSQFAVQYAGRVFLFDNEVNQQLFIRSSTQYISQLPKLPDKFNIVINGPSKSGKKTLASKLSSIYGLKVVNIEQIVTKVLETQKNAPEYVPSNFDSRSNSIHLSQGEWKQFNKGGPLNPKDVLPIVLHKLGIKLQKKPQDWGIERTQQQLQQLEKEREEKEKEEVAKKNAKKTKKKEAKQTKQAKQEQPKAIPLQDIPLSNLIPEINYQNKLEEIKGYIFIGYPTTQDQLNTFKFFNIPIDKYVLLVDNNQQSPNKILKTRLSQSELEQVATFTTLVQSVKSNLGQEIVKEFNINDSVDNLVVKIRNFVDPFVIKVDDDAFNRVSADKQDQDDPVQFGFCGEYCPAVLEQGWLLKGKDEFQCGIRGKRFKCFQQKQFELFKQNPARYVTKKYQKTPPRIMVMGIRGVGLRTQMMKLNQETKIPILNLKDNLISHIENQKLKRRTDRYYNRGFKIPEVEEGNQQNAADADLDEEAADFDRKQNEIQTIKNIFNGIEEILINGNFYDVQQEVIQTPIVDLLMEAHRLPEVVVMLKVDEKRWMQRVFNPKDVEKQHEEMIRQAKEQRQKEIQEARQKALENQQQYQEPQQPQDLGVTPLQKLLEQKKEKLKEQRANDSTQLQEYAEKFKQYGVNVIEIDCERDAAHVFDKIMFNLKPYLENRVEKWERTQALKIEKERIGNFLNNYIVKESRFGKLNPLTLRRPLNPSPLIYRDRLYYLDNEEERDMIYDNPFLLNKRLSIPKDVIIAPIVYVIGKPKAGKSELSKLLSKKLGLVRISFKKIVQEFTKEHVDSTVEKILNHLKLGNTISDQQIVNLIEKRVQMKDCLEKGWILDGFPYTKAQANLLIKKGLAPSAVFSLQLSTIELKERVANIVNHKYSYDPVVFTQRINQTEKQLSIIENMFMNKYNNIRFLNAKVSKWGVFQAAKSYLYQVIECRQSAARDLVCKQPIQMMGLGFSFNVLVTHLSEYKNYCVVTFRSQREYIRCQLVQPKFLSLYKGQVYMSANAKQLHDFCKNPDLYVQQAKSFSPPQMILPHEVLEKYKNIHNKGYCMVELSKGKLVKGFPLLSIQYKDKIYGIGNALNAKLFLKNPGLYEMSTLQDKLPVEHEKKSQLKKIAKKNDCTAFLEHHLGNILMRVLAQLGYRRLKYPTVSSKETALKFLAISLKANNPNKDQQYREKYKEKLEKFIKHCNYSQDLRNEFERKEKAGDSWTSWDEQNLLKLSEEYHEFISQLSTPQKATYFSQFIG